VSARRTHAACAGASRATSDTTRTRTGDRALGASSTATQLRTGSAKCSAQTRTSSRQHRPPFSATLARVTDATDQPSAVRSGQGVDATALAAWLDARLPNVAPPLTVEQFGRGYSNLTYLVRDAQGRELVLRRAPPGVKIKSAHDMGREFRILSALAPVWPKAPCPLALSDDESVIGSAFYVMERVRGVILRAKTPPGLDLSPPAMRRASEAAVDTLAEIHMLDWRAMGLAELGKPEGYVARQVNGWTERYRKAQTDDIAAVDELARWLAAHMPPESGATLVHNDFKYDNVVLDAADLGRVVAVLDWEMATIGDPLMDLGCSLGYWIQADDPPAFHAVRFGPTDLPGNLDRNGVVARYEERTGRPVTNVLYYFAFALFKLAVVAQQLYKRYRDGLTTEPRYAIMLEGVKACVGHAVHAIELGRIDRLG